MSLVKCMLQDRWTNGSSIECVSFLEDVPSLVAHFVYNLRLRFELMTINIPQHVCHMIEPITKQACISAEVCAFKLHLLQRPGSDINKAWASVKHRAQRLLSSTFSSDEERSALHSQIEEVCSVFGNAMSKCVSGRLCNLMGFAQNIKAVIVITDNMDMLEAHAAEIYMRTTSQLPHDSFSHEFMDITEQLRGYMREVIADPYRHSPDETIELVHTLAVWQAEHFLSHFHPEAFNISDVLGTLRSDGLGLVPADVMECYSDIRHQTPGPGDASDNSSGEEKVDVSEKELGQSTNDNDGSERKYTDVAQQSTDDQLGQSEMNVHAQPLPTDGHTTHMSQAGNDRDAVRYAELSQSSTVTSEQPNQPTTETEVPVTMDDMPTGSFGKSGLLRDQSDRVAVVRPQIHCDGVVNGLALEEWEKLVSSVDTTDKESISTVQERLSAAVCDQTADVTCLQDEITLLKEAISSESSAIIRGALEGACREKQRKLLVGEVWIQQLDTLQEAVRQMFEKAQSKSLRDLDSLVLEDAIRQTLEYSGGSIDCIRPLVSAVSDLIQLTDIFKCFESLE